MRRIAITGGIAAGKTTVSNVFKENGAYVVDADVIVHELLSPDTAVGKQVVGLLGKEIVVKGKIDRKKIAHLVFSNPKKLSSLEAILHPAVKQEIENHYKKVKDRTNSTFFVVEVPLLYEAKMEAMFDTVIAVIADPSIAKSRFSLGEKEYELRTKRQEKDRLKAQKADFTIVNDGDIASLKKATLKIIKELQ